MRGADADVARRRSSILTLRWNRGISFSLFPQDTAVGRWLSARPRRWWRRRCSASGYGARAQPLVGLGLGAIVGGALGNGYDRLAYGAVVDFLDLHAFGRHFFVFNLADAAINVGVALLIFDGLFGRGGEGRPAPADGRSGGNSLSFPGKRASRRERPIVTR